MVGLYRFARRGGEGEGGASGGLVADFAGYFGCVVSPESVEMGSAPATGLRQRYFSFQNQPHFPTGFKLKPYGFALCTLYPSRFSHCTFAAQWRNV